MQPVRKALSATNFRRVHCSTDEGPTKIKWTPCLPDDPEAVEKTWTDIEGDELLESPLRVGDFLKSLEDTPPTVTAEDVQQHVGWTMKFGASF